MKKFNCDICGLEVGQYNLNTLYDWYQTDGIEDACEDCYKEIRKFITNIEKAIETVKHSWIRKLILKLRNKHK